MACDRSLVRLAVLLCEQLNSRWIAMEEYGPEGGRSKQIDDLAALLECTPFSHAEGNLIHQTLEPLVSIYYCRGLYWQTAEQIVIALEKIPGKPAPTPA